jgi:hypothetical protein
MKMAKKARLGLYVESEEVKKRIKIAAARRGISATAYCTRAIEEKLARDGEENDLEKKKALITRMDELSDEIGPIGMTASELVKAGRKR